MAKRIRKPPKPFFYFEPLGEWEKLSVWVYFVLTILLCIVYKFGDADIRRDFLVGYVMLPQILFCLVLYRALRNARYYLIWVFFGATHLVLFFIFRWHAPQDAAGPLLNTLILLLIFQLLRWISFKTEGREFVPPSRTGKDLFEEREAGGMDHLIFFAYWGCFIALMILSMNW